MDFSKITSFNLGNRKGIIYSSLVILLILNSFGSIWTLTISTLNISVCIFDFTHEAYGGYVNNSGAITYWDSWSNIRAFSLGVANFDTVSHTLEQVTVITTGHLPENYTYFEKNLTISNEEGLPITLLPRQYWQHNFSQLTWCTFTIAVQLTVDDQLLVFDSIATGYGQFQPRWLTSWSDVYYYTSTTSKANIIPVFLPIIGMLVAYRFRKRKNH